MIRDHIYNNIDQERDYQDALWGGATHDDKHNSHDWVAFINVYLGDAVNCDKWDFNPELFRKAMIKVAALAVAAIEWTERNFPENNDTTSSV